MRAPTAIFCLLTVSLTASPETASPVWTTAFHAETRLIHDTNVFLQDEAPLVAGQSQRGEPVRAEATELIAAASASLRRKPADDTGLNADFGYSFEWHRFDAFRAESHRDHRLAASLHESARAWLSDAKLSVLEVDGSSVAPVYNEQGGVPAIGGEPVRARYAQTIFNASGSTLWHPVGAWRFRGQFTALNQDFHTQHDATIVGCANYVDRGQAVTGLDAGRVLWDDVTVWTSLRAGRQWQANLLGRTDNFTNTLLRPLVGLEGTLAPKLRVTAWAGPDYHRFTGERRAGTDAVRVLPYFETSAIWSPTAADNLSLGAREQLWLGSSGRSAYREFRGDAAWTHRLSKALDTALRFGAQHGNFAGFAATPRNDSIFSTAVAVGEQLTRTVRLDASLTREWSQSRIAATTGRAYERWLGSVGVARTW